MCSFVFYAIFHVLLHSYLISDVFSGRFLAHYCIFSRILTYCSVFPDLDLSQDDRSPKIHRSVHQRVQVKDLEILRPPKWMILGARLFRWSKKHTHIKKAQNKVQTFERSWECFSCRKESACGTLGGRTKLANTFLTYFLIFSCIFHAFVCIFPGFTLISRED